MSVQFAAGAGYQGGPTGVTDGKTYTASIWFKTPATLATQVLMNWHRTGQSTSHGITVTSAGAISLSGRQADGTVVLSSATSTTTLAAATWYHVLIGVDLGAATPVRVYINDVAQTMSDATITDAAVDWSTSHLTLGAARDSADARIAEWLGGIDEIYWTTSTIDLSVEANRELFYGPLGEQVGLGNNGRRPLDGTKPEYFFTHGPGNFGRNEGTDIQLDTVGEPTSLIGPPPAVETLSRGFRGERWRESERSGIPFRESHLVFEPASGLEVARREFSTDRDEANRRRRRGRTIFEY
jgi:hypothetical protein